MKAEESGGYGMRWRIAIYAGLWALFAVPQRVDAQATPEPAGPMGPLSGFIPFLLIIVLFYFLLILPQQRRQKKLRAMLEALKKDDKVVTTSGIYGTIKSLSKDTVTAEVAKGVTVKMRRDAVAEVKSGEDEESK